MTLFSRLHAIADLQLVYEPDFQLEISKSNLKELVCNEYWKHDCEFERVPKWHELEAAFGIEAFRKESD